MPSERVATTGVPPRQPSRVRRCSTSTVGWSASRMTAALGVERNRGDAQLKGSAQPELGRIVADASALPGTATFDGATTMTGARPAAVADRRRLGSSSVIRSGRRPSATRSAWRRRRRGSRQRPSSVHSADDAFDCAYAGYIRWTDRRSPIRPHQPDRARLAAPCGLVRATLRLHAGAAGARLLRARPLRGTGITDAALKGVHLRLPGHGEDGPTLEIYTFASTGEGQEPAIDRPGFGHIAFAVADVETADGGSSTRVAARSATSSRSPRPTAGASRGATSPIRRATSSSSRAGRRRRERAVRPDHRERHGRRRQRRRRLPAAVGIRDGRLSLVFGETEETIPPPAGSTRAAWS